MKCPFRIAANHDGAGNEYRVTDCPLPDRCGIDGEYCRMDQILHEAENKHQSLMTAYDKSGSVQFDIRGSEVAAIRAEKDRNGPISRDLEISPMDRENPLRVETRLPDLMPDFSQAPPQVEAMMGYEPVESMTDKDGSRKSTLYGRDVPWPKPDWVDSPESYAAWLAENTDRARLIEQRFNDAAKPALTAGARRVEITDARDYSPPMLTNEQARSFFEQQKQNFEAACRVMPETVTHTQSSARYLRRIYIIGAWIALSALGIAVGLIYAHAQDLPDATFKTIPSYSTFEAFRYEWNGKVVVSIAADGSVTFGEAMTTDQAAREFWIAAGRQYAIICKR